jgi:hypothetical protein
MRLTQIETQLYSSSFGPSQMMVVFGESTGWRCRLSKMSDELSVIAIAQEATLSNNPRHASCVGGLPLILARHSSRVQVR